MQLPPIIIFNTIMKNEMNIMKEEGGGEGEGRS